VGRDAPELAPALNEFTGIVDLLEEVGVKYRIDITSGRGFEYYTGMMFRLLADGEHIGGGGRYDDLIPLLGGREIPACGFALYLDKLMALVAHDLPAGEARPKVLVRAGKTGLKEAFKLVESLQKQGCIAEVALGSAEPDGTDWVVEVGDEEPLFSVTGRKNGGTHTAKTAREVVALIRD
jgi:histidyl-tRNA synthetase